MLPFDYQATNAQGTPIAGRMEAASAQAVYQALQAQGLLPLEITPATPPSRRRGGRLNNAMRIQAVQELATLLQAGVSISEALPSLCQGHANTPLGAVFDALHGHLRSGSAFSDALAESALNLPGDVVQIIRAGEASGELAKAMLSAVERLNYLETTRQELRNALIYPVILVISGIVAIVLIFALVVPKFSRLLQQGGDAIPWISRAVLRTGLYLNQHWMMALAVCGLLLAMGWAMLQLPTVRRWLEEAVLRMPGIGGWILQTQMGRWTHSLGALLHNHVPLAHALTLSVEAVSIAGLRRRLEHVQAKVRAGERLTDALELQQLVDPMGANLLRVGEQSGRLGDMLHALTQVYNASSRQRMKRFLLLLEPIAILAIGASIAVLMIAIMLAITSLSDIAL